MRRFFICWLSACTLLPSLHAQQEFTGAAAEKICPQASLIRIHPGSAAPSFIAFKENFSVPSSAIFQHLAKTFHSGPHDGWQLLKKENDRLGFTHTRFRQLYKGLRVTRGEYIVHEKDGKVRSVNGQFFEGITLDVQPKLSEQEALQKAYAFVAAARYKNEIPQGELVILPPQTGRAAKPAWLFDIYALHPLARLLVYVDAQNGEVLQAENLIRHIDVPATAATRYSGTQPVTCDSMAPGQYRLRETGRGFGIRTFNMNDSTDHLDAVDLFNATTTWLNNSNDDHVAYDAHWAAEKFYDYLQGAHNRNSIDDFGMPLVSYVHYGVNYDGAFWDGYTANYGDGVFGNSPYVGIDICGHELAHGLVDHTANLLSQGESGALNESFCDIFGTMVEFFANPSAADFMIAEDGFPPGTALRYMHDPNLAGHPDTYLGNFWYTGIADNGGVHINCGVQNYWFYLLAQGGSGINDNNEAYSIPAIGMSNAAALAYRTLTYYLIPSAGYGDARFFSILAAKDLFGPCSPEVITVTDAWHAVGVGPKFAGWPVASFASEILVNGPVLLTAGFESTSFNAVSFHWFFGDTSDVITSSDNVTYTYGENGLYTVTLIVTSPEGCTDTATAELLVDSILVPNVFSPDGDHINDYFFISSSGLLEYRIDIFDRWGTLVFSSIGPEVQWNGRRKNWDACDPGTYFYILKAVSPFADYSRTGFVTLAGTEQ